MTKKGPLSKSEKQYIEDNRELPVGEIAEELDRSEKSVDKYLTKLGEEELLHDSAEEKPAVSATITGSEPEEEEPEMPKAGELMARNNRYGTVIMTEQASMAGDGTKEERLPDKVNVARRHRGAIHKIKGD